MQRLTQECQAHVLQYLTLAEIDVARVVSKQLRVACDGNALWCMLCREHGLNVTPGARHGSWKEFARSFMVSHADMPIGQGRFIPLITKRAEDDKLVVVDTTMAVARPFDVVKARPTAVVGFVLTDATASTAVQLRQAVCAATGCNTLSHGAKDCSWEEPHSAGIHVWDLFPYSFTRQSRTTCLALRGFGVDVIRTSASPEEDIATAAHLLQAMLQTCSTIHVVGASAQQWLSTVGPACAVATRDASAAFNIAENTADVLITGPCDVTTLALPLKSWLLYRCNNVEVVDPSAPVVVPVKRYHVPGYVSALSAGVVSCCAALRMCVAATMKGPMWFDNELLTDLLAAPREYFHRFYTTAMETELSDRGQVLKTDEHEGGCTPLLPSPVTAVSLAQMHDHYFFAALRMFSIHVGAHCGPNAPVGLAMLELLKRDINTTFRRLWRQNQRVSLDYCLDLFEKIFAPVTQRFLDRGEITVHKGLRAWYATMDDKIHEYSMKAKGPRRCDVLWEQFGQQLLPSVVEYAKAHASSSLHIEDVENACQGLNAEAYAMLTQFRADQDKLLGSMQRSSAMFTSQIGVEWETNVLADSVDTMRRLCDTANAWESNLPRKMFQLSANVTDDSLLCCHVQRIASIDAGIEAERARRAHGREVAARQPDEYATRANCVVPHGSSGYMTVVSQMWFAASKALDLSTW